MLWRLKKFRFLSLLFNFSWYFFAYSKMYLCQKLWNFDLLNCVQGSSINFCYIIVDLMHFHEFIYNIYLVVATFSQNIFWFAEHDYWCCSNGWWYSCCICSRWPYATNQRAYSTCTSGMPVAVIALALGLNFMGHISALSFSLLFFFVIPHYASYLCAYMEME